jgi:hypothetical protein
MKKIYALAFASFFAVSFLQAQQSVNRFAANVKLAKDHAAKNEFDDALLYIHKLVDSGYSNYVHLDTASEFRSLRSNSAFAELVQKAKINAFPCMADAHSREFDFWVGEWNAYVTGTNNLAGHSIIQKASGDCMILENWTSERLPYNGKSVNFVDPVTKKWEQVWIGSEGRGINVARFVNGVYKDGAMRFDFETTDAQGNKILGRFSFYNQSPDQVRQLNETSADQGKTWTSVYDFTYKRVK